MALPGWQIALLVVLIVVFQAVAVGVGFATPMNNVPLPPSSPPPIVYPIVWAVLYLLAAVALWFQCVAESTPPAVQWAGVVLMAVQVAASFAWPAVYTKVGPKAATWMLVGMLAVTAAGFVLAAKTSIVAAGCWAPYIVWLAFATLLCSERNTTT
jgi:translocator protein